MSARIAVPDRADTGQRPSLVALPERIAENIQRIEDLGQRLVQALAQKPVRPAGIEGPGMDFYAAAAGGWMKLATEQPARLIGQQVQYWGETLQNIAEAQTAFLQRGGGAPEAEEVERDKRFKNPLWQTNPFFAYVREQYRINADALSRAAADLPIDDIVQRRRIDWFTRQMIDMMAPTNFLGTNPDALAKAIETEGESLVRGLENLVADIEHHQGDLVVSLSDRSAFAVGENIGAAPGAVVHRDPMFELIQYTPTTEQVHKVPLLIIPPWINKFYILDLKPQNSMIRWLVEQGYTLFVVSWKNPGADESDVGMEDYVSAYLSAFEKVRELTGERQLNAVGYCIAGTTLSLALGLLSQRGDDQVRSATFFTTLTDFSDQGEFTAYLQDDFVTGIEEEVARTGYLSARLMQRTFSFLRANDLVWGPAVRHYMMGETPPAFDLLHWNGDGTNLPARMLREYLRNICQANQLVRDGFEVLGHTVRLSDVTVPLCAVACETDHIAPWVHSWRGVSEMGSDDKTFLLSESGHIAGIINPPGRDKYGHYIAHTDGDGAEVETAEGWKAKATFRKGSWWPEWEEWLAQYSGPMVRARTPGSGIEPAPGSYVREQA
nr:class I poly(R)-hydroxyalkanoic acid synthase [Paracoccus sp. Z118]